MKLTIMFLLFFSHACWAGEDFRSFESQGMRIKIKTVVSQLSIPWGFVFLPNQDILITEKEGKILWHRKDDPPHQSTVVEGTPDVYDGGQGGLLDITLHPQFRKTPWVYLTYSIQKDHLKTTRVSRALWKEGRLENLQVLFTAKPWFSKSIHFGSRLVLDDKGYMYFTVGDRNHRDKAQDRKTHNGKVMRLFDDGRIPPDNPFKGSPIWSYGHRNPQGITWVGDQIWINEHGPRGGDEINHIIKGKNYGWPIVTHGKEYIGGSIGEGSTQRGKEDPKKYYVPSIAPSSLIYYNGSQYPAWKGSFFIGALAHRNLHRVSFKNLKDDEQLLGFLGKRVREVQIGPDGFIYVGLEQSSIIALIP